MKNTVLILSVLLSVSQAFAAELDLSIGENATIQPNVATRVNCRSGGNHGDHNGSDLTQCLQDNASLKVQINQLQSELYQCRNAQPKIWNCAYDCGGRVGMGSDISEAVACKAARVDGGNFIGSDCRCDCSQQNQ